MTNRILENKTALIHGAGGAIGGAVARAFARQGAKVFLAGRTLAKLDAVARDVSAAGGVAETTQVDALDERAVNAHADAVAARAGRINIALNVEAMLAQAATTTLLKRLPILDEMANAAVFLASGKASAMTAAIANLSCGALVD